MYSFVIIETNNLTALTVNSILRHMPGSQITTVPLGDGGIATALSATNNPAFVLRSGVVFRAATHQLPLDILARNPLSVSESCVFASHPTLAGNYEMLDLPDALNMPDMGVFHIVPELWKSSPPSDNAALPYCKKAWMPRYMNHKTDKLVKELLSAKDALYYGALGVPALALNYVAALEGGDTSPTEQAAYCFDHLVPYKSGLDRADRERLEKNAEKTSTRYAKMRDSFAQLSGLKNAKANT